MKKMVAVMAVAAMLGAGCSKSSGSFSVETTSIGKDKYKMTVPQSIPAGLTTVDFKNSIKTVIDAQLVRVDGNHSKDEVVETVSADNAPIPDWLHAEGGVGETPPGASRSATMNLVPGSYYVFGNTEGNPIKKGTIAKFKVTGAASSEALPKADKTITANEYSFQIPDLKEGSQDVEFRNAGKELHILVAAPIMPGKSLEDVKTALASDGPPSGPPPIDFKKATGASVLDPGRALVTKMTFKKGTYVAICFMNDRKGGPPHFKLGMLQEIKIG